MTTGDIIVEKWWKMDRDNEYSDQLATLIDTELEKHAQRAAERISKKYFWDRRSSLDRTADIRDIILNP